MCKRSKEAILTAAKHKAAIDRCLFSVMDEVARDEDMCLSFKGTLLLALVESARQTMMIDRALDAKLGSTGLYDNDPEVKEFIDKMNAATVALDSSLIRETLSKALAAASVIGEITSYFPPEAN